MDSDPIPTGIANLAKALSAAQGAMGGAQKDAKGNFGKYSTLASVWDACRDALAANELAVVQCPESDGQIISVRTILMHSSGESIETRISATAKDASPQAEGSVITYLRRYSLAAMVGIAPEDDDGQAAQPAPTPAKAARPTGNAMDRPVVNPPEPTPDAAEEMITKGQMIELVGHCERVFGKSADDRLNALRAIGDRLGREIITRKAMTSKEAAGIIKGLAKKPDGEFFTQPATA